MRKGAWFLYSVVTVDVKLSLSSRAACLVSDEAVVLFQDCKYRVRRGGFCIRATLKGHQMCE